jgi:hypothetical protein
MASSVHRTKQERKDFPEGQRPGTLLAQRTPSSPPADTRGAACEHKCISTLEKGGTSQRTIKGTLGASLRATYRATETNRASSTAATRSDGFGCSSIGAVARRWREGGRSRPSPYATASAGAVIPRRRPEWVQSTGYRGASLTIQCNQGETPSFVSMSAIIGCVKPALRNSAKSSAMARSHTRSSCSETRWPLWAR